MDATDDYLPTASLKVLQQRSQMLEWLRSFFRSQGYWEVQTPVLSHDVCVDAWLEPIAVPVGDPADATGGTAYLQTSPEFGMKRLLAAGAEAIFAVTPAFRRGECGPLHNPEFTMVEWYRAGATYHDQMDFTERLVAGFLKRVATFADDMQADGPATAPGVPYHRLTYADAFQSAVGRNPLTATNAELQDLAVGRGVTAPASLAAGDRDGWLNLLLAEVVEPELAKLPAVFLYDYPASQAALARVRDDDRSVAERFELYLNGIEISNGYQELTDAEELRLRNHRQSVLRAEAGLPALPGESRLLQAMQSGLPESSGVALGFDRLLMVALKRSSLGEVMPFPWERA